MFEFTPHSPQACTVDYRRSGNSGGDRESRSSLEPCSTPDARLFSFLSRSHSPALPTLSFCRPGLAHPQNSPLTFHRTQMTSSRYDMDRPRPVSMPTFVLRSTSLTSVRISRPLQLAYVETGDISTWRRPSQSRIYPLWSAADLTQRRQVLRFAR